MVFLIDNYCEFIAEHNSLGLALISQMIQKLSSFKEIQDGGWPPFWICRRTQIV